MIDRLAKAAKLLPICVLPMKLVFLMNLRFANEIGVLDEPAFCQ